MKHKNSIKEFMAMLFVKGVLAPLGFIGHYIMFLNRKILHFISEWIKHPVLYTGYLISKMAKYDYHAYKWMLRVKDNPHIKPVNEGYFDGVVCWWLFTVLGYGFYFGIILLVIML